LRSPRTPARRRYGHGRPDRDKCRKATLANRHGVLTLIGGAARSDIALAGVPRWSFQRMAPNGLFDGDGPVLTADSIIGGLGSDTLDGYAGDDTIDARDGLPDRVLCGAGNDVALVDAIDRVCDNCETVRTAG
jgi:Ca2+-binding RTX toxin-like protein